VGSNPLPDKKSIRTPDQRLRVFVSSTLQELAEERKAARHAIERLRLAPVMFELGARPHPPRVLYRAYLDQSDIFVGIYWQRYGWVAPDETVSGLEDEYNLSGSKPKLIYIKSPAPERESRLEDLLSRVRDDDHTSYKSFGTPSELRKLIENDLMVLLSERFEATRDAPEELSDADKHNLPALRSSFVGREREIVEVKRALTMTRLLTLTGAGGLGKTRLALEITRDLIGDYSHGVWLVELTLLSDEDLVPQAVAGALGILEQPNRSLMNTLVGTLRSKELLLLLDNCEHLVDAVANLVDALLNACPHLRILATSRESLGVAGEIRWTLSALSSPDLRTPLSVSELEEYEAARLFSERARQRDPSFALTPNNANAVAEICRKLDGIPLALELAAARVGMLSVDQICQRLNESLELLVHGGRTTVPKQKTLKGTMDWSYELLSEDEKRVFGRLSTFVGGWTLEAAEVVASGGGLERGDVFELLSGLIDKSLVVAETTADDILSYMMLESIRQYAREKLKGGGEDAAFRRRHAEWYLAFAEEAERGLSGPHYSWWLDKLETEDGNLRAALRFFIDQGDSERGLQLAAALGEFWRIRGYLREGLWWLEAALTADRGPASPARVKVLTHAGWIAWELLDFEKSTAFSKENLELSRMLEDKVGAAFALYHLGMVAIYEHMKANEAWGLFEESLTLRRQIGDEAGMGRALQKMGLISVVRHDFELAMKLYEECLELAQKTEDKVGIALALWLGGLAYLGRRDHRLVSTLCAEGLNLARRIGYTHGVALMMHVLAASASAQGQPIRSARLWGAAESLLDSLGFAIGPAERSHFAPYMTAARERLDDEAWEAAWAEGKTMPLEEAVEYSLLGEE
jgi:predicted ATPase